MKSENDLLIQGIDLEISDTITELKNFEYFKSKLERNDLEYCKGFLQGKLDLINNLEKLRDLRRSKKALENLDSSYGIDTNFPPMTYLFKSREVKLKMLSKII